MRRIVPALVLLVLSPLVAEFLLGDFTLSQIFALVMFVPLYGCGAVLIRETTRRLGRGWPTLLLLATAYAVLEEGLLTQSLFNPHYLGLSLLDYGYVPALGIGTMWTLYVLPLHIVWSVAVPIVLTETLFRARAREPWLGKIGLVVLPVLFVIGIVFTGVFSYRLPGHFLANPIQLAVVVLLVALLVVLALRLPRRAASAGGTAPSPWLVGLLGLVASTALRLIYQFGAEIGLPAWLGVPLDLVIMAGMCWLVLRWSASAGWTPVHRLALASGALLTYDWVGLHQLASRGTVAIVEQCVLIALIAALVVVGFRKLHSGQAVEAPVLRG